MQLATPIIIISTALVKNYVHNEHVLQFYLLLPASAKGIYYIWHICQSEECMQAAVHYCLVLQRLKEEGNSICDRFDIM
jgi:hypothetical protein